MNRFVTFVFLVAGAATLAQARVVPDEVPDVPFAGEGNRRGFGTTVEQPADPGQLLDWEGTATGYGGTAIYSRGEYVYQDHLFDAWGADDGADAERLAILGPVIEAEPRTFRTDHAVNYAIDELGAPVVPPYTGEQVYGDADPDGDGDNDLVDAADLVEVRVASDGNEVAILVRTTTMRNDDETAILVLLDSDPSSPASPVEIPFNSGLSSDRADLAILVHGTTATGIDLRDDSAVGGLTASVESAGYENTSVLTLPRALFDEGPSLRLAVATGLNDGGELASLGGVNVANVAFRLDEPVLSFFEQKQALVLHSGTIDPFFAEVDEPSLLAGRTQSYVPAPGYHDAIFRSSEAISEEHGEDGVWQHYGLFVPSAYASEQPNPLQFWIHFRGGKAHTAAAVVPRIMEDYGEEVGTIVVSPRARGTSTWYVGKGHVDFLEVWDDVHARFNIDPDRVYVSGHSMGGWGTYLLTTLYPDRFAAGMPVAGPITQGLHLGCEEDFCNQEPQNGGRVNDQYTGRMLPNLRHVPLAIFQGAIDELVWVSGVTAQALRLAQLGYPYRYYLFPTYEHYSHPIVDEWEEGVRYMHHFTRNPNPRCVTYIRDMPFEQATEQVQSDGVPLDFDFDSAYWMSGLVAEEVPGTLEDGTPGDLGVARFDGCSLAIEETPTLLLPAAGGPSSPGQAGPYVMTGLDPFPDPLTQAGTTLPGFWISLSGATAVTLDLVRMSIDTGGSVFGTIGHQDANAPLALTLDGDWPDGTDLHVSLDGGPGTTMNPVDGRITVNVPVGMTDLLVEEF